MTHPCPECKALLPQCGEVELEGKTFPVFQCEKCIRTVDFLGERVEVHVTFAVDGNGQVFDPDG